MMKLNQQYNDEFKQSVNVAYDSTYVASDVEQKQGFRLFPIHTPANGDQPAVMDSEDHYLFRYGMTLVPLEKPLHNRTAFVMMMNPGNAGKNPEESSVSSDKAVDRVFSQLKNQYKQIFIVNTMPFYEADSNAVAAKINLLRDQYDLPEATWQAQNRETLQAYIDVLKKSGEANYDVLLGTGEITKLNRVAFRQLMDEFPEETKESHLFVGGELLGKGDAAYLSNWRNKFSFTPSEWRRVTLVPGKVAKDDIYHLEIVGGGVEFDDLQVSHAVEQSNVESAVSEQNTAEEKTSWISQMTDDELADLGRTPDEIQALRAAPIAEQDALNRHFIDEEQNRWEEEQTREKVEFDAKISAIQDKVESRLDEYVKAIRKAASEMLLKAVQDENKMWLDSYTGNIKSDWYAAIPLINPIEFQVILPNPEPYHTDGFGTDWAVPARLGDAPSYYGSWLVSRLTQLYGIGSSLRDEFQSYYGDGFYLGFQYQNTSHDLSINCYGKDYLPDDKSGYISVFCNFSVPALLDTKMFKNVVAQLDRPVKQFKGLKESIVASGYTIITHDNENSKYYELQLAYGDKGIGVMDTLVFNKWKKGELHPKAQEEYEQEQAEEAAELKKTTKTVNSAKPTKTRKTTKKAADSETARTTNSGEKQPEADDLPGLNSKLTPYQREINKLANLLAKDAALYELADEDTYYAYEVLVFRGQKEATHLPELQLPKNFKINRLSEDLRQEVEAWDYLLTSEEYWQHSLEKMFKDRYSVREANEALNVAKQLLPDLRKLLLSGKLDEMKAQNSIHKPHGFFNKLADKIMYRD